ncbi:EamA-like transporter family protein [Pseudodesulfovibrio sp. JC047]|uniref:DMT family transporter n=1 Tax=Pseudodesulfovibrio sp. JC047 TaxID=2683199 RepID=UPI0013D6E4F8|nr:DMT family transporter [Pseudodesulfovibrio sp. JC047]NDV20310.1 EamA-like transporter family protein [Pseudodesulfovibrio sp. JC047]
MKWMFVVFALVAGALMPVQAGVNLRLKESLGDPIWAAAVSFAVGTLGLFAYGLISKAPIPTPGMIVSAPAWAWTGGLFGGFFVFAIIVLAGQLGAATMMAWLLAGQFLAAILLDHYGLISFNVHMISWQRIVGVLLLITGATLINKY